MSKIRKYQNPPKVKISLHTTTVNTPDKGSVDKPITENLNINAINKMNIFKSTYSLPISLSDVCRFQHYGNTCWYNSVV